MDSKTSQERSLKQKWRALKHSLVWTHILRNTIQGSRDRTASAEAVLNNNSRKASSQTTNSHAKRRANAPQSQFWLGRKSVRSHTMQDIHSATLGNAIYPKNSQMIKSTSLIDQKPVREMRFTRRPFSNRRSRVVSTSTSFQPSTPHYYFATHPSPLPSPLIAVHESLLAKTSNSYTGHLQTSEESITSTSEQSAESVTTEKLNVQQGREITSDNNISNPISEKDDDTAKEIPKHRQRRRAVIDENAIAGSLLENTGEDDHGDSSGRLMANETENLEEMSVCVIPEREKRLLLKHHTFHTLTGQNRSIQVQQSSSVKKGNITLKKLIGRYSKTKDDVSELSRALREIRPHQFDDHFLESFRNVHWSQLTKKHLGRSKTSVGNLAKHEVQRREAVWELFKCELLFLLDHLMVLKNCFMEPLKTLQVDGYLMFVEPGNLFGNLDELCYGSHALCRDLISALCRSQLETEFGSVNVFLPPLERWAKHSKDGEVFHAYCLNYDAAISYLDQIRKYEQFNEFEKWCQQDPRCRRLQLTDLLIAPMQHYTKIPLLLTNIRQYLVDQSEQEMLNRCLGKMERSLKTLEDKMRWLQNFELLQGIQSQLIWPSISELEPRVFIPTFLRQTLSSQPCERLLANPKRQLVHEGYLAVSDRGKMFQAFAFLFDDFLLITKIKKQPKKKLLTENVNATRTLHEGGIFIVYKQPIPLDRITIHDIGPTEASANGLRCAFVLIIINRFQQLTAVYTIQTPNVSTKQEWLHYLRESQRMLQVKIKFKLCETYVDYPTNVHGKAIAYKSVKTTESESPLDSQPVSISSSSLTSPPSFINAFDQSVEETERLTSSCQNTLSKSKVKSDQLSVNREPTSSTSCPENLTKYSENLNKRNLETAASNDTEENNFSSVDIHGNENLQMNLNCRRCGDDSTVQKVVDVSNQQMFSPPLSPILHAPCSRLAEVDFQCLRRSNVEHSLDR